MSLLEGSSADDSLAGKETSALALAEGGNQAVALGGRLPRARGRGQLHCDPTREGVQPGSEEKLRRAYHLQEEVVWEDRCLSWCWGGSLDVPLEPPRHSQRALGTSRGGAGKALAGEGVVWGGSLKLGPERSVKGSSARGGEHRGRRAWGQLREALLSKQSPRGKDTRAWGPGSGLQGPRLTSWPCAGQRIRARASPQGPSSAGAPCQPGRAAAGIVIDVHTGRGRTRTGEALVKVSCLNYTWGMCLGVFCLGGGGGSGGGGAGSLLIFQTKQKNSCPEQIKIPGTQTAGRSERGKPRALKEARREPPFSMAVTTAGILIGAEISVLQGPVSQGWAGAAASPSA